MLRNGGKFLGSYLPFKPRHSILFEYFKTVYYSSESGMHFFLSTYCAMLLYIIEECYNYALVHHKYANYLH
jgi:hypothetical protein